MIVECPACRLHYDVAGRPPNTLARCRCGREFELPSPDPSARPLTCPGCGGNTKPTQTQCAYCDGALAPVRCARCFTAQYVGFRHCTECGAALRNPARALASDGSSALQCPRCETGLIAQLGGATLVDHCRRCGGLWLDHAVLENMLEKNRRKTSVEAALGHMTPLRENPVRQPVVYTRCPECETLMTRRNFGRQSGIIVDICPAHGVWFDHGELEAVMRFVRAGGLAEPPPGPTVSSESIRELLSAPGTRAEPRRVRAGEPVTLTEAVRAVEDFIRTVIEEVRD